MQTISLNLQINLFEEGKWLLTETSFEATNSVFHITNENQCFSISTASHWNAKDGKELFNNLDKLLEPSSETDNDIHVKEVEKRGTRIEKGNNGYISVGLDHFKCQRLAELKRVKYKYLYDMLYRMEITYDEIIVFVNVK